MWERPGGRAGGRERDSIFYHHPQWRYTLDKSAPKNFRYTICHPGNLWHAFPTLAPAASILCCFCPHALSGVVRLRHSSVSQLRSPNLYWTLKEEEQWQNETKPRQTLYNKVERTNPLNCPVNGSKRKTGAKGLVWFFSSSSGWVISFFFLRFATECVTEPFACSHYVCVRLIQRFFVAVLEIVRNNIEMRWSTQKWTTKPSN